MRWKISLKRLQKIQSLFDNDFYPLFICGVAGSGTTLLGSLLDQRYENAAYINESALSAAPDGSVLKMKKIAFYKTLANYYQAMFIPDSISDKQVRDSLVRLYRRAAAYPKVSTIVIDKAPNLHLVRARRLHDAWRQSKFLLIFRDPVSSVEGLRRKWPLFAQADLVEVCDFWESTHKIFLDETSAFAANIISLSYNDLTYQTETMLDQLAKFCGFRRREISKKYPDRPNVPGKGLRNVVNGQVAIASTAKSLSAFSLSAAECEYVQQRLAGMHDRLNQSVKVTN